MQSWKSIDELNKWNWFPNSHNFYSSEILWKWDWFNWLQYFYGNVNLLDVCLFIRQEKTNIWRKWHMPSRFQANNFSFFPVQLNCVLCLYVYDPFCFNTNERYWGNGKSILGLRICICIRPSFEQIGECLFRSFSGISWIVWGLEPLANIIIGHISWTNYVVKLEVLFSSGCICLH